MKIIKQGDFIKKTAKKTEKHKTFECLKCGCIFEADEGEYRDIGGQYFNYGRSYVPNYVCICPCCGEPTNFHCSVSYAEKEKIFGPYSGIKRGEKE